MVLGERWLLPSLQVQVLWASRVQGRGWTSLLCLRVLPAPAPQPVLAPLPLPPATALSLSGAYRVQPLPAAVCASPPGLVSWLVSSLGLAWNDPALSAGSTMCPFTAEGHLGGSRGLIIMNEATITICVQAAVRSWLLSAFGKYPGVNH